VGTERSRLDLEANASPSRLLGRELELGRLAALVGGVHEGGGALVVRGEAGIGKSALLAVAAARAREQGLIVFQAAAVEAETQLPFAGLHALLRPFLETSIDCCRRSEARLRRRLVWPLEMRCRTCFWSPSPRWG
jgi:AAA ATPase domain